MSKKYLRSNMSQSEARFFSMGHGIWGKENSLTNIFKIGLSKTRVLQSRVTIYRF